MGESGECPRRQNGSGGGQICQLYCARIGFVCGIVNIFERPVCRNVTRSSSMSLPSAMPTSVAKSVESGDRKRPLDQGRGRQSGRTRGQIRAQTVVSHRQVSQRQDRQAVSRKVLIY